MSESNVPKRYTVGEEIFNSVSHGVGAGLSCAATVLLIVRAVVQANAGNLAAERLPITIVSFSVFGFSLIVMYMMSTLYHALTPYGAKNVFRIFDHTAIYLLIAGTYTPYCLVALQGTKGWVMFGIVWAIAIFGITMYSIFGNRIRVISVFVYVAMGWIIIFQCVPIYHALSNSSFSFLISGGVAYTAGVPFYALKKYKWAHSIWHLFVLMGSILQFFSVLFMI